MHHIKDLLDDDFGWEGEDYSELEDITPSRNSISTGISTLDDITNGFSPSELIILAGRPAMGKSSLALNIAANIALRDHTPVLFISLKMTKQQIVHRIICSEAEISTYYLKMDQIPREYGKRFKEAKEKLKGSPIYIKDKSGIDLTEIISEINKLDKEIEKPLVVVIDDLQNLAPEPELTETCRQLKMLTKDQNIVILLNCQVNANVENRENKRPSLSDITPDISGFADLVMFIFREEYYSDDPNKRRFAELIIAKQKNGPLGTVELFFDASLAKFSGMEYWSARKY